MEVQRVGRSVTGEMDAVCAKATDGGGGGQATEAKRPSPQESLPSAWVESGRIQTAPLDEGRSRVCALTPSQ